MDLPEDIVKHLSSRLHRLYHYTWHRVRDDWALLEDQEKEKINSLQWGTQRPSLAPRPGDPNRPAVYNGSGEDFFFMHRQMIADINKRLSGLGEKPLERWGRIPSPSSSSDPVSPAWNSSLKEIKSDEAHSYRFRTWDWQFKDPGYLRQLSLGEFGALLEWSVHNSMHVRWSAIPWYPQVDNPLLDGRLEDDISKDFDNPKYDYLNDTYSSHINPIFWKLHGWVDDRIEDWASAHGDKIQRRQLDGVDWFETGEYVHVERPWVGAFSPMGDHHPIEGVHEHEEDTHDHSPSNGISKMTTTMEAVHEVLVAAKERRNKTEAFAFRQAESSIFVRKISELWID